jgi:FkbM family methyltransferase
MGLLRTCKYLVSHPLNRDRPIAALGRFARWQVATRVRPGPRVIPYVNDLKLRVERGMTSATSIYYTGLTDYYDKSFIAHVLREDDLFVDVGANVGTYVVLAAGVAGARCVAVEPVPASFATLEENVRLNGLEARVELHNVGVAAEAGTRPFTTRLDANNRMLGPGEALEAGATTDVPVTTLDAVVGDREPLCLMIDVEGFEAEVVAGGAATLARPSLKIVVMETFGLGADFGHDDAAIHRMLLDLGFETHRYWPEERRLEPLDGKTNPTPWAENTLYLRDAEGLAERVKAAPAFKVRGHEI